MIEHDPNGWHDAGTAAVLAWEAFTSAPNPILQAYALVKLNDAMSDLVTWLPGYDVETGELS